MKGGIDDIHESSASGKGKPEEAKKSK